jgi:hypothetical protein
MSDKPNDLFLGLVASLQMSAWIALGKIVSPMTQKIERDLEQAKETIDLLGMLEEKTRGNLHADEARLLERLLYELRLNYVDEMKTGFGAEPTPPANGGAAEA